MPFALLLLIVNVVLVVHAAKTGRFSPWGYVIILLPGVGALAYVLAELLPAWFASAHGQRAQQRVTNALDPERRYREFSDQLAITDTIANRAALAEECLDLGKFSEAEGHYSAIMARPMGDEPAYMLGRARAEFGLGQPQAAVVTLDDLRARWPDFQSADGHLLYVRALEEAGRLQDAVDEYKALSVYYPGAEARVRYALLLQRLGRDNEARMLLNELLAQMRRAPGYVRKVQADWIAAAEKALRD